jgi:hypothetical protein
MDLYDQRISEVVESRRGSNRPSRSRWCDRAGCRSKSRRICSHRPQPAKGHIPQGRGKIPSPVGQFSTAVTATYPKWGMRRMIPSA